MPKKVKGTLGNPVVKMGDKIIVTNGNDKTAIAEGIVSKVISITNTIIRIETPIDGDNYVNKFLADGRDGTYFVLYDRGHIAEELAEKKAFLLNEANEKAAELDKEITRLGYNSDEEYKKAKFKADVLEVAKAK